MINLEERFEECIHFGEHLEAKAVKDLIEFSIGHGKTADETLGFILRFVKKHILNDAVVEAKHGIEVELDSVGDLVAASDAHEAECDKDYPAPRRCR